MLAPSRRCIISVRTAALLSSVLSGGGTFRGIPSGSAVEKARREILSKAQRELEGLAIGEELSRGEKRRHQLPRDSEGSRFGGKGNLYNEDMDFDSYAPSESQFSQTTTDTATSAASSPILASDTASAEAINARNVRNYVRLITSDFHGHARTRPIPQVPWLQDTRRSYLDDAERVFGRKEGWHLHPDPETRRKLMKILTSFIKDTISQSNELRSTVRSRQSRLRRLGREYAHFMLVAAFDPNPSTRIRNEWRVPKTAEDLVREEEMRESAPMVELLKAAEEAKRRRLLAEGDGGSVISGGTTQSSGSERGYDDAGVEGTDAGGDDAHATQQRLLASEVRSRLDGSPATGGLTVVDPFHSSAMSEKSDTALVAAPPPPKRKRKSNRNNNGAGDSSAVDMQKEGLMHMRLMGSTLPTSQTSAVVEADLRAARERERQNQFPFLRQRVAEDSASLDSSLVDWTQSFFPDDDASTFKVPAEITQRQIELAEEDRRRSELQHQKAMARIGAAPNSTDTMAMRDLVGGEASVSSSLDALDAVTTRGRSSVPVFDSRNASLPNRAPLSFAASSSDDVDSAEVERLRGMRAADRLSSGSLGQPTTSTFDSSTRGSDELARYEDELLRMQSKSRQELQERKTALRKAQQRDLRAKKFRSGRYALGQSLEKFVDKRLRLFDGQGMAFEKVATSSASGDPRGSEANPRVDHQGIPLAHKPRALRVRTRGQAVRALGGVQNKERYLSEAFGNDSSANTRGEEEAFVASNARDVGRGVDAFVASSHLDRFASTRFSSSNVSSYKTDRYNSTQESSYGGGASGAYRKSRRHIPDTDKFNAGNGNRVNRHYGDSNINNQFTKRGGDLSGYSDGGDGGGSVNVDWQTTVLTRRGASGTAGPKWHRANERLVRLSRGQQ